jgi:7-carboxy-7-deazaguanine synthase
MSNKYYYSEVFHSIQGEGHYTGAPTAWLRFHMCNLNCDGFGQKDATDPSTYILPYQTFDLSQISKVEDLPVWEYGCDSSYTWAKQYQHLMKESTASEMVEAVIDTMKNEYNPKGLFKHPVSGIDQHMCFTGGEPLMPKAQKAIVEMFEEFHAHGNTPRYVTIESNGTQKLRPDFVAKLDRMKQLDILNEFFFSISPKLWTVAGEKPQKAIKPEVVATYAKVGPGQLKFVVGPKQEQWDELDSVIAQFREAGVDWPVWIMPIGATLEEQDFVAGDVAKMALARGYNVAARVHVYLFGNAIGT